MTPVRVTLPDLGTTADCVVVEKWRVKVGDRIRRGDILADIQTDKATSELESVAEGVVLELLIAEGESGKVGDALLLVGPVEERTPVEDAAPPPVPEEEVGDVFPIVASEARDSLDEPFEVSTDAREDDPGFLRELYRKMALIRAFEERVKFLFLEGRMPGTIHQCQGQEAVAVGVCAALDAGDVIASTHRPHGHALAKGIGVEPLLHELFGKPTGCCRGKGGSMHVGDLAKGMIPAIAIVGGNVPLATGAALAFRMRGEPRVAVCFLGDGAVNEGAFHEAVNMGALWKLPVVYVVENNLYAASTPVRDSTALDRVSDRARGYGIPGVTIDGNDVLAVYRTARAAVARARAGRGPTLVDAVTYRITGHSRRDPCNYQPEEERRRALAREPVGRFAAVLRSRGAATSEDLARIRAEIDHEIEAAVVSALNAPDPAPEDALTDVYV